MMSMKRKLKLKVNVATYIDDKLRYLQFRSHLVQLNFDLQIFISQIDNKPKT